MSVWPIVLPGTSDGATVSFSQARLKQALKGSRPCDVNVVFERLSATRSPRQNRAYWGVTVEALSTYTGYTKDEIHELIKARFLTKKLLVAHADTGEVVEEITIGTSTARLEKMPFSELMRQVQEWAATELGFVIPDPDPRLRTREF